MQNSSHLALQLDTYLLLYARDVFVEAFEVFDEASRVHDGNELVASYLTGTELLLELDEPD